LGRIIPYIFSEWLPKLDPKIIPCKPSYLDLRRFYMNSTDYFKNRFVNDVEAAKILSMSPQSLRNYRNLGKGPAYSKKGRMVRYQVQDLLDYMSSDRIDPEARRVAP
jgi:hypothetical protein